MAIDPYKGGKCWSCKFCDDVGYYDEDLDYVYKRKCHYPGKEYLDTCTKYCYSYVWDGKDSKFNYTNKSVPSGSYYSSSSSSGSSYSSSSSSSGSSYSSSSSSSSSGSSSYSSSSSSSGWGKGCLITLIVVGLSIAFAVFLFSGKLVDLGLAKEESTSQMDSDNAVTAIIKHTGNVNLRKKASSKSGIITSMPPGSTVTVFEETEKWAKIEFEGQSGWCFKKYLDFQD